MHSFFCHWPHWTLQKIAITSYELSYSHRQVIYYYISCVLFLNKIGANYSFLFLTSFRIWVNSLLFLTFLCCSYGVYTQCLFIIMYFMLHDFYLVYLLILMAEFQSTFTWKLSFIFVAAYCCTVLYSCIHLPACAQHIEI